MANDAGHSRVFVGIRDMLLNDGYEQGDPLPTEGMLIETFSCSRSSLREALKQLQTLGLVEIRRGIGTFVGPLTIAPLFDMVAVGTVLRSRKDPTAFLELLETRIALDVGMAGAICERFVGSRDEELDRIVDQMVQNASIGGPLFELDKAFHTRMQGAVGNRFALDLVMNFWDVFGKLNLEERLGARISPQEVADSHRALVEAAYAGDRAEYRRAIERHYEGSRRLAQAFAEAGAEGRAYEWLADAGWS